MHAKITQTRLGWIALASDGSHILYISLPAGRKKAESAARKLAGESAGSCRLLDMLGADLVAYFDGGRVDLGKYPVSRTHGTKFQRKVWAQTSKIHPGKTVTYGDIARALGAPQAARAVGQALNANPTPILVPCHRVVSSSGLGGFAGGAGLKRRLLRLEGALV